MCVVIGWILQGFLSALDISLEEMAAQHELEVEVVRLFDALCFNVCERGESLRAGVMLPFARLGAVAEAEKELNDSESTLTRLRRDYGWKELARFTGLTPLEDARESSETLLA